MEPTQPQMDSALETLTTELHAHLLRQPIEYIFADHIRQRALCFLLDEIASGNCAEPDTIRAVCSFLETEFKPHILDEEAGLFPLLRQRAEPEDEIDDMLGQLMEEHESDGKDAREIIDALHQLVVSEVPDQPSKAVADLMTRFAANERQHLIVENSIALPLARVRLTQEDCKDLARRMAEHRGITWPD